MFKYYLKLSLLNIKRAPTLYALVLVTLAIGLGAFIANIAMINIMGSDPIPQKSDQLFHVSMNTWTDGKPLREPFDILRYDDAMAIKDSGVATRTAITYYGTLYTKAEESKSLSRHRSTLRATTGDFFAMMDAPFKYGGSFSNDSANEVVLSHKHNNLLFAGENSVGKYIDIQDQLFKVIGVLDNWRVRPRFYHPLSGVFEGVEDIFLPLESALDANIYNQVQTVSSDDHNTMKEVRGRQVYFLQTWVELNSKQQVEGMQSWMDSYSQTLRDAGQHPNDIINRLHNVNEWLEEQQVMDNRIIAFGIATFLFLIVCLFNASSLLLARYESGRFETALKRALGVSKAQLIAQGLVESLIVGLSSGMAALGLSWVFLEVSKYFISDLNNIAEVEIDTMAIGMGIAIIISVLCMLYPLLMSSNKRISTVLKG